MSRVLPILFNTEMVQAILDNRKTATRRLIRPQPKEKPVEIWDGTERYAAVVAGGKFVELKAPYQKDDTLYIRETWNFVYDMDDNGQIIEDTGHYVYYADDPMPFSHWVDNTGAHKDYMPWRPSIHMPKAAARIWLKVTDVKTQRLQDMTLNDFLCEGVVIPPEAYNDPANAYMQARDAFIRIWESTIKDTLDKYGWAANPWVWVIEFEQCEKPESEE